MGNLLPLLITAAVLLLLFRFLSSDFQSREPSEAVEEPQGPRGNPFSRVPSPRKNSPSSRAGAIALAEPDDEELGFYPPRIE